ncbi:Auxin-responsive protein IAA26 [Capsicum annuum]|nr:Auxin-responsive protein IAA26 [Capsicum annuum]
MSLNRRCHSLYENCKKKRKITKVPHRIGILVKVCAISIHHQGLATSTSAGDKVEPLRCLLSAFMDCNGLKTAPAPVVGWPPVHSFRKNLASSSSVKPAAESSQNVVPSKSANEKPMEICQKGLFAKINMGDLMSLNAISVYKMSFELITLRFYHGRELNMGKVKGKKGKRYEGGQVTEFLDVDVDRLSLFKFRNYVRSDKDTLDISKKLGNGQVLEAFVCHMVGEPEVAPLLEFVSDGEWHVEGTSGVSFNKDTKNDIESVDRASKNSEDAPRFDQPIAHTSSPPTDQPTAHVSSPRVVASSSYTAAPTNSIVAPFESVVDSDVESIDGGIEIGSDVDEYVDEELRGFREKKKKGERETSKS